ncbi:MAG: ATP synthase F1 subunit delta [Acholeplasma sp.]|nr:ATP synthase F1 subunit delta [Acholeplasma sp.]
MTGLSLQYAEALYFLACENKKEFEVLELFESFLPIYQNDLKEIMLHPKVSKESKKTLLESLKLDSLFIHFLFVLIDKNRMDIVEEVLESYKRLIDHKQHVLRVVVTSQKQLKDKQLKQIELALQNKHKRRIIIETKIDPKIVGGLKIAYEGSVIDNTINQFIKSLSESLKA